MTEQELKRAAMPEFADGSAQSGDVREVLSYYPLTELGNAERLRDQHGQDLRYVEAFRQWLVYDGARFALDCSGEVARRAKQVVRGIYAEAAKAGNLDSRKAIADWGKKSERAAQIMAMLKLAESEPGIPVSPGELDADPWLLNCLDCTVNLRTGERLPHQRENLITKCAPVRYDPAARAPRWEEFLRQVFEPHPDLPEFIQKAAGYSLSGSTREECLFLLHGTGRNGKGVMLRTLGAMLGDYAATADFGAFVSREDSGPRDDVANMAGARFIVAQEAREGAAFAESIIKWLTGGDKVRARRLYQNSFEFDMQGKLWLASNYKPRIKGTDLGIWSRIRLIPFEVSFAGREDKNLKVSLLAELPGILAWAVEGCIRYCEEGLGIPDAVTSATAGYRQEQDAVGRFLDELCVQGDGCETKARPLYGEYRKWAEGGGDHPMSETAFGRRLTERGFVKRKDRDHSVYVGIGLIGNPTLFGGD